MEELELLEAELISKPVRLGDDSWLSIHMPEDYRNAARQLKTSADNLNLTASGEPGWRAIYDTAVKLWEKYHDIGFWASLTLTDATWMAIADSQRRVDEFAAHMRAQKKPVVEPSHKPIDNRLLGDTPTPTDMLAWLKRYTPWLIGTAAVIGVGSIAVPIVAPLLAARRALR